MSGPTYQRVIQLELNEISSAVVRDLIKKGLLPNFARVQERWAFVETTSETRYEHMEPWIQWVTAHTGKSFEEHGIFRLGDASALKHPQIWEVLSRDHIEAAIVGSMNCTRGRGTKGGFFFPDPWAKSAEVYPPELQPLWNLISDRVQGHATSTLSAEHALRALQALAQFRLPLSLYARIARQLVRQRVDRLHSWRLALLFDEVLAHVFLHVMRSSSARFLTLFLNGIAHYQHHYWRNFEPARFNPSVRSPDCHPGDNPMLEGYQAYDRILGKILRRCDMERTLVIIASGLSQVPYVGKEREGGMNYYRLRDHQAFLDECGLRDVKAFPMMSRDFQVGASSAEALARAEAVLGSLTVGAEPLLAVSRNVEGHLFVETAITRSVEPSEQIRAAERVVGLFTKHFVNTSIKSGHHTGTGSLWLSDASALPGGPRQSSVPLTKLFELGLTALSPHALDSRPSHEASPGEKSRLAAG